MWLSKNSAIQIIKQLYVIPVMNSVHGNIFIVYIIFMAAQSRQKLSLLFFLACKQFLLLQFLWITAEVPLPNQTIMQNICGKNFDAITNLRNCRTKYCCSNSRNSTKSKSLVSRIKSGRQTHWIFCPKLISPWSFLRTFSIERVITKYHCVL